MSARWQPKAKQGFDTLHFILIAVIFGIIGTVLLIISRAAPNPPTIYLTPSGQTFASNTTFTIQVREDSGNSPVNAVQANFSYPTNLVEFVSIDTSNGAFATIAESSGANGQIKIAAASSPGTTPPTGDRLIASVTFRTRSVSGSVNMNFLSGTALVSSQTNNDLLTSLNNTGSGSYTVDATPPTVSVTAPSNGAVVSKGSGSNIAISVNANDNSSVSRVEIYVNNNLRTSLTSSPYNYNQATSSLPLGPVSIYAKAFDPYGNTTTSSTINITLVDTTPPTVSITQPTAGSTVGGTVTIGANAADENGGSGLSKVEFYINGTLRGTDTAPPYTYTWDTSGITTGNYTLTARAYDSASPQNSTLSPSVSVTVDNSDRQAPTVPGNVRVTSRTQRNISLAWNASTDNVGVTGYRIRRNGTVIATVTSLTYNDTNVTAGTSYNYTVSAVDANNNASAQSSTLTAKTLRNGDANGDDKVNIFDVSILLSHYNKTNNSSDWANARVADMNNNNEIDIFDLSIMLSNYDHS